MNQKSFTLVELIVAVALMAILGVVILINLNPSQQYAKARNTQRISHTNIIAEAVRQRIIDNHGTFQTGCSSGPLPSTSTPMGSGTGKYNIEPCLVPVYLSVMPLDPVVGTSSAIGYNIFRDSSTTAITISAPNAELDETILIVR